METVGLLDFFSWVIGGVNDTRLRLYVYDWESNLNVHHSLEFFTKLFEAYPQNAVGIKDSSGVADMLEERCQAFPDKEVFAGTDFMTLTSLRAGGSGVMSGISNIVPDVTTALYAGFEGDQGDAMQAWVGEIRARWASCLGFPHCGRRWPGFQVIPAGAMRGRPFAASPLTKNGQCRQA